MKRGDIPKKQPIEVQHLHFPSGEQYHEQVLHENTYEILYTIHGDMELHFQNQRYFTISGDSLMFIPANIPYTRWMLQEEPLEFLTISFHHYNISESRREILLNIFDENLMGFHQYYTNISDSPVYTLIQKVIRSAGAVDTDNSDMQKVRNLQYEVWIEEILLETLCFEMIDNQERAFRSMMTEDFSMYSHKVAMVLQYIRLHQLEPITVAEIAQKLYLDKSHMQTQFKKEVGIPIKRYIMERKVRIAQRILHHSDPHHPISCADLARDLGYQSYSTFYRTYLSVLGHAPNDELQ